MSEQRGLNKMYSNTDFLVFAKFVWNSTGINFEKLKTNTFFNKHNLVKFIGYLNLNLAIFGEILYFIFNFTKFKSVLELTDVMSDLSLFTLAQIKMYKLLSQRKLVENLFESVEKMFPLTKSSQKSHRVHDFYKRGVYGVMFPFTVFTLGAAFIVVILPIIKSVSEFLKTGIFVKRLPFLVWYPFKSDPNLMYILIFIHQGFVAFTATVSLLSSDLMLFYITLQICMQFTGICSTLKYMKIKGTKRDIKILNKVISHHKTVLK